MPYTSELVQNSISWPTPIKSAKNEYAHGRESNVIRPSNVFLAMYNPQRMIEDGWNGDFVNYVTSFLGRFNGMKEKLINEFRIVEYHPDSEARSGKRDFGADVSSMSKEGLLHRVNLGNLPYPVYGQATKEQVLDEALAFLNVKGSCTCGAVKKKGEFCSMPADYYADWTGVPLEEYDRILSSPDEPKPYGHLICKHQLKVIVESGRFPHLFDKWKFYSLFRDSMLHGMREMDEKRKGRRSLLDLDKALMPSVSQLGLGVLTEYLKERSELDERIEGSRNNVVGRLASSTA